MQVMICGAGLVTGELLKRLGTSWRVTLIEKDQAKSKLCMHGCDMVVRTIFEDASSAVVLDEANIAAQDYVLALTDRDAVNLEVVRIARDRGVPHILALVHDPLKVEAFEALEVRVVLVGSLPARHIYHFLEDPRVSVTPLVAGQGEVLEVDSAVYFRMIGRPAGNVRGDGWRLSALVRKGEFLLADPSLRIEAGDRMIIVGKSGSFQPVCSLLECNSPHFPLAYGRGVLVGLLPGTVPQASVLDEALYLAKYTKVSHVEVVCAEDNCNIERKIREYSNVFDMQVDSDTDHLLRRITDRVEQGSVGCVVVPPFESSMLSRMFRPRLVGLAHAVGCPLLVARGSGPYRRVLVPYHRNSVAELTLEVAIDFTKQVGAELSVIIVEEEDFVHGEDWKVDPETLHARVLEIGHTHKIKMDVLHRRGNPVREITEAAAEFDLLVVGSSTDRKGLFFPHVGELLTEGVASSVLVVTS